MRKRVYKKGFWYDCYNIGIEDLDTFIGKLYLGGKSTNEIAEYFFSKYKITVSGRNICKYVSKLGITRSKSEGKAVAIKSGRMVYRKKKAWEKYSAKGISAGTRLKVLTRDDFRCVLCGNGRHNGYSVELHHKDGDSSVEDNLETLCFLCHRGLHENKKNL